MEAMAKKYWDDRRDHIRVYQSAAERTRVAARVVVDMWGPSYSEFASTLSRNEAEKLQTLARTYKQPIALARLNSAIFLRLKRPGKKFRGCNNPTPLPTDYDSASKSLDLPTIALADFHCEGLDVNSLRMLERGIRRGFWGQ